MVTYEMLTGLPPWYTTDKQKLFDRLRNAPLKFPLPPPSLPLPPSLSPDTTLQSLLQRNPEERLGSRGGMQVMSHRFFADIDWGALNRREISPPLDPCRDQKTDEDTTNFEKEFTNMPMFSVDEDTTGARVTIQSDELFSQFTYEGDSYLDRLSSRSMTKSPEFANRRK
jgi:serum/glucocorticoid-regulated kinase 3